MAMLSYPCMEESCVLHCASVTLDSATLLRTMLELTVELSKQKRKQAPTVNSSILLTSFQMNEWLFTCGKKDLRLSKRYEGEMECKKETLLVVKFVQVQERKNCAIFICPYRETAVATIPAIDFNPRENEKKL